MRLLGFFVATFLVLYILRTLPVVGAVFDVPILGFWGAAILVSLAVSKGAEFALERRKLARRKSELGRVATPHNHGKLGSLLAGGRRFREAVPHLELAVAGEPDVAEWRYRLGCALLAIGRPREAAETLAAAAELDEEHAYGGVLMRLSQARLAVGDPQGALAALDRRERNHGLDPETAYRKALALRALGQKDKARACLAEVAHLARNASRYRRGDARKWAWRAFLARLA